MLMPRELDKPLVLCVDDDATILDVTRLALERRGYRVLTVNNGGAALEAFSAWPVDAVILDYEMPGMNGGQIALEMKRIKPHVPKMLFSSYSRIPSEETKAFQGYCSKPTNLLTFTSQVRELTSLRLAR